MEDGDEADGDRRRGCVMDGAETGETNLLMEAKLTEPMLMAETKKTKKNSGGCGSFPCLRTLIQRLRPTRPRRQVFVDDEILAGGDGAEAALEPPQRVARRPSRTPSRPARIPERRRRRRAFVLQRCAHFTFWCSPSLPRLSQPHTCDRLVYCSLLLNPFSQLGPPCASECAEA